MGFNVSVIKLVFVASTVNLLFNSNSTQPILTLTQIDTTSMPKARHLFEGGVYSSKVSRFLRTRGWNVLGIPLELATWTNYLSYIALKLKHLVFRSTHSVFKSIHLVLKIRESTLVLLNLVFKFKLDLEVKEKKELQWDKALLKTVNDDNTTKFMWRAVDWAFWLPKLLMIL